MRKIKKDESAEVMSVVCLFPIFILIMWCSIFIYKEIEQQKDYEREQIELLEDIKEELQKLNNETAENNENQTNNNG